MPEQPPPETSHVDDMIDALREGGEVDSEGTFTLNRKRARERLREFELADPGWYLLLLVQAAVRQGAQRIEIDVGVSRITFSFDGRPFDAGDLETMYDELFSEKPRTQLDGRHELALGLNAALAIEPSEIKMRSADGKRGVQLVLVPGKDEEIQERDVTSTGTTIEITLPVTGSDMLERTMSDAEDKQQEEALLRERCAFAEAEIVLRLESEWLRISHGLQLFDAQARTPLQGDGLRGEVGFLPDESARAEMHIVLDGVWITTHTLPTNETGLVAVVTSDGLRKDLSQFDVVRDAAYATLKGAVKRAAQAAFKQAQEQRRDGDLPVASKRRSATNEDAPDHEMEPPTALGLAIFFGILLIIAAAITGMVVGC